MTDELTREAADVILGLRSARDSSYQDWVAQIKGSVERVRRRSGLALDDFLNAVALRTAREFAAGRMTFSDGDVLANDLWFLWISSLPPLDPAEPVNPPVPPVVGRVFLAFDAGEFIGRDEPPGTDPVEKYTRPQVESIVADFGAS